MALIKTIVEIDIGVAVACGHQWDPRWNKFRGVIGRNKAMWSAGVQIAICIIIVLSTFYHR
jgi:hypothetical protein